MTPQKSSQDKIDHSALELALQRLSLPYSAAEYHGSVCGRICAGGKDSILLETEGEPAANQAEMMEAWHGLEQCWRLSRAELESGDMTFSATLPDDEEDLLVRTAELGAWCRGYLYGLASIGGAPADKLSPEGQEIIEDLAAIAQVGIGEDDQEVEEASLAEIVEYLRVTIQIIYLELRPGDHNDQAAESIEH